MEFDTVVEFLFDGADVDKARVQRINSFELHSHLEGVRCTCRCVGEEINMSHWKFASGTGNARRFLGARRPLGCLQILLEELLLRLLQRNHFTAKHLAFVDGLVIQDSDDSSRTSLDFLFLIAKQDSL
jgi:hypothetical protein